MEKNENSKVRKLVLAALFASLCCVLTMLGVPSPIGGHIHLGDSAVLLSAFMLGPLWGAAAAGIGSALANIFLGIPIYAPATLVIKAAMAFCAAMLMRWLSAKHIAVALTASCIAAGLIMIVGYFSYQAIVLGFGLAALAEIPGNIAQALFGALAGSALYLALRRVPI